jgi:hypothetical protein
VIALPARKWKGEQMSADHDLGSFVTLREPEDDGFKLRTLVLFKKHLDLEFAALYAHVEVDCV